MNTKEKILFISSKKYLEQLNNHNLDYENHNRLFWCHLAALSFVTTGIYEFHLDLNYSYLLNGENNSKGVIVDKKSISFYTTTNALIELSNKCTRSSFQLNNSIFGKVSCYQFKNKIEEYLNSNLHFPDMDDKEFLSYNFNKLFLKLRIKNRKSEETQSNFLQLLTEQCPELNYFLTYLKTKEKLVHKNSPLIKTIKI